MKQLIFSLLSVVLAVFFCSCGDGGSTTQTYYDENGNFVIESDHGVSISYEKLPGTIKYNDSEIAIQNVSFYETETNYEFTLFAVVELDVSSLSDSQLHWLQEDDASVNVYLTSEKNGKDFDGMSPLGSLVHSDGNTISYVLTTSAVDENRYSFAGSEAYVSVMVSQEETYEYKHDGEVSTLHKDNDASYKTIVSDPVDDAELIEEPLYSHIIEWLESKAQLFS